MKSILRVALAVLLLSSSLLFGASNRVSTTTVDSNRMQNRLGVYLGLLGDPFPTVVGLNLGYNVTDFFRVTAGGGRISASSSFGDTEVTASATTLGLGTRFFVPGWNFSPVVGLSFAHVMVSHSGNSSISVSNFNDSGSHFYGTLGFDWQTGAGFNMGAGYNVSFKSGVGGLPYLNLGWFFDII